MSKKLLKRSCWVLIHSYNGNKKPFVHVLGVFKKQYEAKNYLKWLNPKDIENYDIRIAERFIYVDTFESKVVEDE